MQGRKNIKKRQKSREITKWRFKGYLLAFEIPKGSSEETSICQIQICILLFLVTL